MNKRINWRTGLFIIIIILPSYLSAQDKTGKQLYEQYCLPCHQADGSGVPQMNPPLQQTTYVNGDPARLINIILNGLNDNIEINGETYDNAMPPFASILNDKQVADVLTYIRSNFKNSSGPVTMSQVKSQRVKKINQTNK
jgi:mono/diheme cytochrome c family protein